MARSTRASLTALLIATAIPIAVPAGSATVSRFHPPTVVEGRAFPLLLPADGRWLNWRNTYGAPRMRLVNGTWQQVGIHQGIDIFAERGTPIVSITAGTVENAGWTFYSGYRVGVRGTDGGYWFYAHLLARLGPGIAPGARVRAGQILGYLGSSGYGPEGTAEEFPPHLHFGLQRGSWIDPNDMLVGLYDHAVAAAERHQQAIRASVGRERRLRSALYSAPGLAPDLVVPTLGELRQERARLEAKLIVTG